MGYTCILKPARLVEQSLMTARFLKRIMTECEVVKKKIAALAAEVDAQQAEDVEGDVK
jgi:hypothetical protein